MRARPAGFTLLELVLAMAALAMLSAICYGAFHTGIRAVERGEVAVVTAQRLRAATDVLIRQVKSAFPYPARTEDDEVYPYFDGTAEQLSFVTAVGQLGGGGLALVTYRFEHDPPRLVLEESPFFSPSVLGGPVDERSEPRSVVLLDGFEGGRFEYLLDDGVEVSWEPAWSAYEEEVLPSAVRILVDRLPGLENDQWGQEIPIMVTTYGESNAEVDDDALLDDEDAGDDEDLGDGDEDEADIDEEAE